MSAYKTDPLLKDAVSEKVPTQNKRNLRREHVADFRYQVDFCIFWGVNLGHVFISWPNIVSIYRKIDHIVAKQISHQFDPAISSIFT